MNLADVLGMKSPLGWLALGTFAGVWSWLVWPASPWLLSIGAIVILALLPRLHSTTGIVGLGLCLGQALVWTQPEPSPLRPWTTGEIQIVTGKTVLLLTPEGHISAQLWPAPPPVGTRIAGRLQPKTDRASLPGEWPHTAQAQLARAQLARMTAWTPLSDPPVRTPLPDNLTHPGLLRALGSGDRSEVPAYVLDLLRRTGTIHLLAISGLHIGMVSMMAGLVVWVLTRGLTRGQWPAAARLLPVLSAAVAAVSYGELVGWPVSTQRAVVMVMVASLLSLCGRRPSPWQALGAAALVVLAAQPSQAASLGFLMSFGAVAAILSGMTAWTQLIPDGTSWPLRTALHSIGASVFATMGTLPVTAWVFQTLPIGSPLANLVAVPLIAGIGVPASIVGMLGPPILQEPALWVADHAMSLGLLWIRTWDIGVMTPAVGAVGAIVLVVAGATLNRPHWSLILLCCALSPWRTATTALTVTFPAVGQGGAALIQWPDGRNWLIDGGPPGQRLLHWLRREGVRRLDRVILSHPDTDHFGGLVPVLTSLDVGELWASRPPAANEVEYRRLWREVHSRSIAVRVPPVIERGPGHDNDEGLVVVIRHGQHRFLFLGDVSEHIEATMAGSMPPMTVVQVSHHGSRTSSSPALIAAATPEAAVIQCGIENRYGHPHPQTLSRWTGTKLLRTDTIGSIQLQSDGRSLIAHRWNPAIGWRSLHDRRP